MDDFTAHITDLEAASSLLAECHRMTISSYCGYITIVFSIILLVAQVHYIYQTASRRKLSFNIEFSIVLLLVIAVFDIMQIVSHFASGIQMIRYSRDSRMAINEDDWTSIFGALLGSGWNGSCCALCYLTMHRFFWLFAPKYAKYIVSSLVSKIFLCLLFLFVLLNTLFCLVIGESHLNFSPSSMGWIVSPWILRITPIKNVVIVLNTITNSGVVYFNLPFLVGISYLMIQRKKRFFNNADRFILVQMLSFYIYATMTWFLWEFVAFNLTSYFWKYVVNIMIWMIWNGMKPLSAFFQEGFRYIHRYQHQSSHQCGVSTVKLRNGKSAIVQTVREADRGRERRTIRSAF